MELLNWIVTTEYGLMTLFVLAMIVMAFGVGKRQSREKCDQNLEKTVLDTPKAEDCRIKVLDMQEKSKPRRVSPYKVDSLSLTKEDLGTLQSLKKSPRKRSQSQRATTTTGLSAKESSAERVRRLRDI